jgi:hypothetical protein
MRTFLGFLMVLVTTGHLFAEEKSAEPTVRWLGYIVSGEEAVDPAVGGPQLKRSDRFELGLRSDGVVVWRERAKVTPETVVQKAEPNMTERVEEPARVELDKPTKPLKESDERQKARMELETNSELVKTFKELASRDPDRARLLEQLMKIDPVAAKEYLEALRKGAVAK